MVTALAGFVGARFLGAGLGLLTQLVLARTLLPADVTVVLMAMSASAFLSLLMNGGETQLASTHLPRLLARRRSNTLRAFHGTALRGMVLVFVCLVAALAAAWWFQALPEPVLLALGIGLLCAPFSGLARYNSIICNSMRWFPLSYVPDFIVRPGLFLLAIAALIAAGFGRGAISVLAGFAVLVWLVGFGQSVLMQGQGLRISHWQSYRARYAKVLRPRSLALLLVSVVSFAFADVVMLLAGLLLPAETAAVAGVAVRLAAIAGFVLQAAQLFILPDFTQAMERRQVASANALLWRMNGLTLVMALAGLVATLLLGRFALSFFGTGYVEGVGVLTLFMVGQSIRALGGMNQNLLAVSGHQIRTASSCLVALVILVLTALLFTSAVGLVGLGLAVIAAELAWMLGLAAQANGLCGRRADLLWLARHAG